MKNVRRNDSVVQTDPKAVDAVSTQLLHQNDFVAIIASGAAIRLRKRQSQKTRVRCLAPHIAFDTLLAPPLSDFLLRSVLLKKLRDPGLKDRQLLVRQERRPVHIQNHEITPPNLRPMASPLETEG